MTKRLCSICARGGSKGVPNKNIRLLAGKPLLVHSIEKAQASKLFDTIAVSSDSPEILSIARKAGVEILVERPELFAADTSPKIPAIRHCAENAESATKHIFDTIVDLDATSPLRSIDDIHDCVKLLESDSGITNVITAAPARRSPYFNLIERQPDGRVMLSKSLSTPVMRRQDAPQCFDMNASIYVWRRDVLFSSDTLFHDMTALHVMPEERSLDIDSELDFSIVEMILQRASK